jgi:hypothetical protein
MQHDSAPAAANFVSLLFIAISLDIAVPWRDSVRCSSDFWLFGAPKVRRKGRIQRSDTWAGEDSRSVSQSGGKEDSLSLPLPTSEERQHPHKPTSLETGSRSQCYSQC